ncbi:MAG: hypothetical protein U0164_22795 [Gemmatimonadaceae bacterium]
MNCLSHAKARSSEACLRVDDSADAFLEGGGAEVDEESKSKVEEAKVGKELFQVRRGELLERLELDDDDTFDQQVDAEAVVEAHPLEFKRHHLVALHA